MTEVNSHDLPEVRELIAPLGLPRRGAHYPTQRQSSRRPQSPSSYTRTTTNPTGRTRAHPHVAQCRSKTAWCRSPRGETERAGSWPSDRLTGRADAGAEGLRAKEGGHGGRVRIGTAGTVDLIGRWSGGAGCGDLRDVD